MPVIPQMLNFAECAYDPKTLKIICWYRNEVTPFQLKGTNAYYIKQAYAITPDFISKIINAIQKTQPKMVEIHSNIVFTNVELYPIIASISKLLKKEQIKIHLYDDGIRSIGERLQLSEMSSNVFPEVSAVHIKYLQAILQNETNPFSGYLRESWPLLMNYLWHNFFDVTYYLMDQYQQRWNSPFQRSIQKNTTALATADIKTLNPKQLAFCLSLLNLTNTTINEIKKETKQENSLLYMGAGYFNRQKDDAITEKQIIKIQKMRAAEIIKPDDNIIFKAHPINSPENRAKIVSAFASDNIYTLPNHIPFEILPVIGLAPSAIICTFSTLLFTMKYY
ncbi:polysialyltransferase family glycosyltransferase [Citrobacter freundii]|uniref:polysialyltransferase family glycosyltransferase n=1 Tax=Citrobacter freundii TaxID=546 RepID=UPI001F4F3A68